MTGPTLHAIRKAKLASTIAIRNTPTEIDRATAREAALKAGQALLAKLGIPPACLSVNPWDYQGDELKPFDARPGALQALSLPSRRGANLLLWPCGRWTDLLGNPIEESVGRAMPEEQTQYAS